MPNQLATPVLVSQQAGGPKSYWWQPVVWRKIQWLSAYQPSLRSGLLQIIPPSQFLWLLLTKLDIISNVSLVSVNKRTRQIYILYLATQAFTSWMCVLISCGGLVHSQSAEHSVLLLMYCCSVSLCIVRVLSLAISMKHVIVHFDAVLHCGGHFVGCSREDFLCCRVCSCQHRRSLLWMGGVRVWWEEGRMVGRCWWIRVLRSCEQYEKRSGGEGK